MKPFNTMKTFATRAGNLRKFLYAFAPKSSMHLGEDAYLGELVGLASGVKKTVALELTAKGELSSFLVNLKYLAPKINFKTLIVPAYKWIKKLHRNYHWNAFVGKRKTDLILLEKYYRLGDHRKIGICLSYPLCCSQMNTIPPRSIKEYFFIGQANKIDFRINNFYLRSLFPQVSILRHCVCQYRCFQSIKYAEKVLNFLAERFPNIYKFYSRVLKLPILMVASSECPQRIIGDSVIFTFLGYYKDAWTLLYDKIYYHGNYEETQYLNKKEGKKIFAKLLLGNKIKIKEDGTDIYLDDQLKASIQNKRLVFINPVDKSFL